MKRQYTAALRIVTRRQGFDALLIAGSLCLPCRIGHRGAVRAKREGDGCTPRAVLPVLRGWWRADRRLPPRTGLRLSPLRPDDGWCDAPGHGQYNRPVRLPMMASHEKMWRLDHQYDVVLELGWNTRPRVQNRGSAIFLHITSEKRAGTAGCIAVAPRHIDRLMARIGPRTVIDIR